MTTKTKTADELIDLIQQWEADGCWDLEDTEGFEEHRKELLGYRRFWESIWRDEHAETLRELSLKYDCSRRTAEYIYKLEKRLQKIENKIFG